MQQSRHTYEAITVLGPTACGKTTLAVALADALGGEVVSVDSRQVYRSMDLGTGKDLDEYAIAGRCVPYHMIDLVDAGMRYNVFSYMARFHEVFADLTSRHCLPVLCGGTGMYLEAVLKGYRMLPVPENAALRRRLQGMSLQALTDLLSSYKTLHNTTDVDTPQRAIRAIEIADYQVHHAAEATAYRPIDSLLVGIRIDRDTRRARITRRLHERLEQGMIDEVDGLLQRGIAPEQLIYYGLEYKYITLFLTGQLAYPDMVSSLETAIHQFAKRQMTWFRGMERRGLTIRWLDYALPLEQKIENVKQWLS